MATVVAVVPIFVSAGAAVMPTIVAAVASVAGVILKPREMVRVARERPRMAGLSVLVVAAVAGLITWHFTAAPARAATARAAVTPTRVDWAKVAQAILDQEATGKAASVPGAVPMMVTVPVAVTMGVASGTATMSSGGSAGAVVIQGHDVSRASFAGGVSPGGLKPFWRFTPEDTMFFSAPAVGGGGGAAGKIFVAGSVKDLAGMTGVLACLDAATGKPVWQKDAQGDEPMKPYFSSPALTADGKYLVIGQGLHQDKDCALLGFEAATGKLLWAAKTPLHIESSPAIFGDMAVVGAGAIELPDGRPSGDPGFVLAVSISTGKELWRQRVIDPESSPAIDAEGIVYIGSGFNGSAVVAMRSDSDDVLKQKNLPRILWQTPAGLPITSAITLIGDLVITAGGNGDVVHSNANAQGTVLALNKKTGAIQWQTKFPDSVLGAIAARDGVLICPVRNGEVAAVSASDGKILWHTAISGKSPVLASCAFTGEKVYAVSSDGILAVLDAKDGKVLEKVPLNDPAKPGTGLTLSAPQVIDGNVIVGSETGGLRCLVGTVGKGAAQ